jgi:hypothetical protein
MAKDRNTFAKRAREQAKRQKAEDKRLRRARKQDQPVPPLLRTSTETNAADDELAEPPILPFPARPDVP